jgi:hypothetical protein
MTRALKVIAFTALLTAVPADAGPIAYQYVTGPVSLSSQGAPAFEPGTTVSGTFKYDPGAVPGGPGTVPGTLVPDVRGSCDPCDFQGFVLGDYHLVNVRLFWLEGLAGAPDFLASSDLPTRLPEFPGRLALDIVPATGVGPTVFVFFDNLLVQPVSAPDPGALLQQLSDRVEGVGPGKSLAAKVTIAQTYYAVPDAQATCAVLTGFINELAAQRGKHVTLDLASELTADAQVIMTAIGCD